jgi:hypothetical protein
VPPLAGVPVLPYYYGLLLCLQYYIEIFSKSYYYPTYHIPWNTPLLAEAMAARRRDKYGRCNT